MAISHTGKSATQATGSTSLTVGIPGSTAAGNLLLLCVVGKYPPNVPTQPSGWTLITNGQHSGGAGSAGADSGSVHVSVFYKVSAGSEGGSVVVSIPSGNSAAGVVLRYANETGEWGIAATYGADSTQGTAYSITGADDPGITAGDMVTVVAGTNTDLYTYSAQAVAATGISAWGTVVERFDAGATNGDQCWFSISEHPVTTGTSSAAPTFGMTSTSSNTNRPCGAAIIVRLRQTGTVPSGGARLVGGRLTDSVFSHSVLVA